MKRAASLSALVSILLVSQTKATDPPITQIEVDGARQDAGSAYSIWFGAHNTYIYKRSQCEQKKQQALNLRMLIENHVSQQILANGDANIQIGDTLMTSSATRETNSLAMKDEGSALMEAGQEAEEGQDLAGAYAYYNQAKAKFEEATDELQITIAPQQGLLDVAYISYQQAYDAWIPYYIPPLMPLPSEQFRFIVFSSSLMF